MNSNSSSDVSSNSQAPALLVVTGPTGAGKTGLAIALARELRGEIINADSVQLYEGFRIGASQPSAEEFRQVPHHLFDCFDPRTPLDVAGYVAQAERVIGEIQSRGAVPIVSGGTGLYVQSLLHGLNEIPAVPEEVVQVVRAEVLERRAAGLADLEDYIRHHDPQVATVLPLSDTQRIVRALSVRRYTGRSLFEFHTGVSDTSPRHAAVVLVLLPPRDTLYAGIEERVDQMWAEGLIHELERLRSRYGNQVRALESIGYVQAGKYLDGVYAEQQARDEMKRDTRRFAKRQMTWWRNQPRKLGWRILPPEPERELEEIIRHYRQLSGAEGFVAKKRIAMLPLGTVD